MLHLGILDHSGRRSGGEPVRFYGWRSTMNVIMRAKVQRRKRRPKVKMSLDIANGSYIILVFHTNREVMYPVDKDRGTVMLSFL